MKNWENLIVSEYTTLKEVMILFERYSVQIALVSNKNNNLLGVVTDGDMRRSLLRNVEINDCIKQTMNTSPVTVTLDTLPSEITKKFNLFDIKYLPIIDKKNVIKGLYGKSDFIESLKNNTPVVIMAGGEGLRMRPLTERLPKSMVGINGTPIIEKLLSNLIEQGFSNFFFSINYLGEIIENYFGDGRKWGGNITYLKEGKKLGTGGALSLLKGVKNQLIILNGDLVTNVNFKMMLDYHKKEQACVTVGVKKTVFRVPYGVVNCKDMLIQSLDEKPIVHYNTNCGIYTLSAKVLDYVLEDQYVDMPCIINHLLKKKEKVVAFPIYEAWQDIGNIHDLEKVHSTCDF